MEDDFDVPPLEDMSSVLQERAALQWQYQQHGKVSQESKTETAEFKTKVMKDNIKPDQAITNNGTTVDLKPKTSSFGGLNKGFLFSSSTASKTKANVAKSLSPSSSTGANANTKQPTGGPVEDLTHIKATATKDTSKQYQFDDVQQAMKGEALLQNKEWITEDLLSKVQSNELLIKRLSNPQFVEAIGEFQKNPEQAKEKYKGNVEVQQFFAEFCGLLGEHFIKLSDQQQDAQRQQPTTVPKKMVEEIVPGQEVATYSQTGDLEVQKLLANPTIREALLDSNVQRLIDLLKTDSASAQRMLSKLDDKTKKHVQTLVSAGILQLQR